MIKSLNKNPKKKKKGFTLIELIIVIAIIAIIAAFAIPNFMKVQNNSKIDADVNTGKTIANVVEVLYTDGTISASNFSTTTAITAAAATPVVNYLKTTPTLKSSKAAANTIHILTATSSSGGIYVTVDDGTDVMYSTDPSQDWPEGKFKK